MSSSVTTRLFFADGHSELVALPAHQAYRDRYLRPIVTGATDRHLHWRAVAFKRLDFWVPPEFVGPLPSDDVRIEHDNRSAIERDLGIGPPREGWRIVGVFVEVEHAQ